MGGDEILAPVLDPFHRPAKPLRRDRDAGIFRIERALGAEAAADIGRDDAKLIVVQIERIQELRA